MNYVLVFYSSVSSVESKLASKRYDRSGSGLPTSYNPPNSSITYLFYKAPDSAKERDSILVGLYPFQLSIAAVFIDDGVNSIMSKSLIVSMAEKLGLKTPQILESFN